MPFFDGKTPDERKRMLFTDDECRSCGGKGYHSEGERAYDVDVILNAKRIVHVSVLAIHTVDAIRKAAELLYETYPSGFKPGDQLTLETIEHED